MSFLPLFIVHSVVNVHHSPSSRLVKSWPPIMPPLPHPITPEQDKIDALPTHNFDVGLATDSLPVIG